MTDQITTHYTASDEARELYLYITNDYTTWQSVEAYYRLLERKRDKGVYNTKRAVDGMSYAVETGAKRYAKEFGTKGQPWHKLFVPAVRNEVCEILVGDAESEWEAGNFWTPVKEGEAA